MFPKSLVIPGMSLFILIAHSTTFAQREGDQYVSNSLKRLLTINTIECDIRIETFVDGKEYTASGHYEEQALPRMALGQPAPFLRSMYRLDIFFRPPVNTPMASDAEPNRMTLVCRPSMNGERGQVERRTSVEGNQSFHIIDLVRLEERLQETNMEMLFAHVSEVHNLGGLAGKMRQISRFYEFSLSVQENLHTEETIPTLKLTGRLRSILHAEMLTMFGGLDKLGNYPADFPSDIELWLGRHNDFPYKIRYLRRISEHSEQKKLLYQESFFNVVLNGTPIPASRFDPLKPPDGVFAVDDTDRFIRALGLERSSTNVSPTNRSHF